MAEKFKNKYRIPSARLQHWDYGSNGSYFITICTQNREHFFGEIENQRMTLNEIGQLAKQFWYEIPQHFPFVELGNFVVMPNHTHGILIIQKTDDVANDTAQTPTTPDPMVEAPTPPDPMVEAPTPADPMVEAPDPMVEARLIAPLPSDLPSSPTEINGGFSGTKNPIFHDNSSRIIRWYKGRCTFEIRKTHADFAWQSRFHDHIIRNQTSFQNISRYILNNPTHWKEDKFNQHLN